MKTVTLEVGGLISTLSALGVQKQLARQPGVNKAEVNYVSQSATVTFDEKVTNLKVLKRKVRECGYHCAGERLPRHVCEPEDPPGEAQAKAPPAQDHRRHATHVIPAAKEPKVDAMAHEMGHGAGMDIADMVKDMRNRFLISLIFTIPIF